MVEPFAWSRGMANANWPILSWYHPHDGLAEGADKGVSLIFLIGVEINLFSELIYFMGGYGKRNTQRSSVATYLTTLLYYLHCHVYDVPIKNLCTFL